MHKRTGCKRLETGISNGGSKRSVRGFTLVELLVVIAIIALLMSILMPALSRAKKQANAVVCQANLQQWGMIFALYATDNEGSLPQSVAGGTLCQREAYWITALVPYYEDRKIRLCPSAANTLNPPECNRCPGTTFSAWGPFDAATDDDWWETGAMGSYGINEWCSNPPGDSYWGFPSKYAWRSTSAKGAGQVPLFLDCIYIDGYPMHYDEPPEYPGEYRGSGGWANAAMKYYCIDRHERHINGVFLDSSVRKIGLKELWRLKWHQAYPIDFQPPEWPVWMRGFKDY